MKDIGKQNELVRTLQKQLLAIRQELADQKWILNTYLNSPSWRLTAPLRWVMRRFRGLKSLVFGKGEERKPPQIETDLSEVKAEDQTASWKELYLSSHTVALQALLSSEAVLEFPPTEHPLVSIILVLFNRAELTLACLRSIRETLEESFEVIIVDNASSDETPQLLRRIGGAHIIRNVENRNFLLAVNQAACQARGRYLLLLNNDAQLLPGSLHAALATLESAPDIGAVGGRLVLFDGSLQEAGSIIWRDGSCLGYGRGDNPFMSSYMFRRDVDYCSGAFLLTPRSVWEKLGGFDEVFVPAYYEETDYCARLWEQGLRVVYEPAAVLLHYEFASSRSTTAIELQAKHRQTFAKRHTSFLQNHLEADLDSVLAARVHPAANGKSPTRMLFIDDQVPHPWLGSGFPRARTLLLSLRKYGVFLTVFPMALLDEDWDSVYSELPRDIEVMNEMGPPLLEAFLRHRMGYYDAIFISRPHNMNYLRPIVIAHPEWFQDTSIIYDAEALFAPRDVRFRELSGEQLTDEEIRKIYEDEIHLTSVANCVIAVSEVDRKAFQLHGSERVHMLGHSLDVAPTPRTFEQRSGFLFVGAIHEEVSPNGDSMIWFLSEIWPGIQERLGNEVTLTIAGINNSEKIRALAGPSVRFTGHLEDITELYNAARVFVAPTRYAAGIPHKVHEASAYGVPVVATTILARQLNWADGVEISVAADAGEFAAKCVDLYQNKQSWTSRRDTALAAIRRECSSESFLRQLREILTIQDVMPTTQRCVDAGMER